MPDQPFIVFYDGGCPLCSREINHYRRIAGNLPIRWVDVVPPSDDLSAYGLSRQDALQVFHVIDPAGITHKGVRAFMALWDILPRYRWLARVCRTLHAIPLLEWAYRRFANWHYARRCREGVCE